MIKSISDAAVLANGVKMPWLGLGVFKTQEGAEVENSVRYALEAGYRHIDTAAIYRNEEGVGRAVKASGIAREELFITTKVWNTEQGYETTLAAFEESRRKLGLEYVDLYLIHWAVKEKYKETWRALEKLYRDGLVRAIGVSNFQVHHLQDLMATATVKPMVNQVEYHPYLTQQELLAFCQQEGIQFEAWSPLMRGRIQEEPVIVQLAEKYGKTPAQIVLRWDLQHGVVTIPKSIRQERVIENAQLFDFALSAEDLATLDGLNRDQRFGSDPDNFNFK
ncbi:diketogulonate reductase-like aldo/keto reductase [Tumebacillus sp. BK434]|uniref:aldo/keto reductase n=1 Tax=Tumebacillus sp. BK434 TaxID=2512169 RepID=UPI00104ACD22|nr:aldo/keto reductase [Tumebacillus sp. BK434]TCP57570.1 diketogulonate reductase-like aldo/keto reductase [Tumebacillus sp. BK434]